MAFLETTAKYCSRDGTELVPYPMREEQAKTLADMPAVDSDDDTKTR
jgi:hypothetical protein